MTLAPPLEQQSQLFRLPHITDSLLGLIDRLKKIDDTIILSRVDIQNYCKNVEELSPEWFALRRDKTLLTASRLAAAIGLDVYTSRQAYFEERVNGSPQRTEPNFHMQRGTRMEPIVIEHLRELLSDTGWRVIGGTGIYKRDCLAATPDGFVVSPRGNVYPLEVKNRSRLDDKQIPLTYAIQMHAQMFCTNTRGSFYFSVCNGEGWNLFFLPWSEVAAFHEEELMPRAKAFIEGMLANKTPGAVQRGKKAYMEKIQNEVYSKAQKIAFSDGPVFKEMASGGVIVFPNKIQIC